MTRSTVRTSPLFLAMFAVAVAAAMVPALYPGVDIAIAGYFLQPNPTVVPSKWLWVELLNEHIPTIFRVLVLLCLPAWLVARRTPKLKKWAVPIAFVGLGVLLGPGLTVGAVKDFSLRARPFHVTEFGGVRQFTPALTITNQCDDNCAFVSGHAADGFFLASIMLIARRRRGWWVAAGVAGGLLIGFARISVGAHWLSDVLWAFPITLAASWIVWRFLYRGDRQDAAGGGD